MKHRERCILVVFVVIAVLAYDAKCIYDPRTHVGPNLHMMPQVHGDYSKVHNHKSDTLYTSSNQNTHYRPIPHSWNHFHQQVQPTVGSTTTECAIHKNDFVPHKQSASKHTHARQNSVPEISKQNLKSFHQPDVVDINKIKCPHFHTGYLTHSKDCKQFLNCWKGHGIVQSCAPGTLFNSFTLQCDHPSNVKCEGSSTPKIFQSMANIKKPHKLASYKHNHHEGSSHVEQIKCPPDVVGLREHPTDCRKFINCNNGATFIQDCAPGTAFDAMISACNYIHKVDCSKNHKPTDVESPLFRVDEQDVETVDPFALKSRFDEDYDYVTERQIGIGGYDTIFQRPEESEIRPVYAAFPPKTIPPSTTARTTTKTSTTKYNPNTPKSIEISNLPMNDALKLLLRPYLAAKDVELNMTKMNDLMRQTTTTVKSIAAPRKLEVLGLDHAIKPQIASPDEINSQLTGQEPLQPHAPVYRPPVSQGFRPYNPNFNRQHASPPVTLQQQQLPQVPQPQSPQRLYPVYQPPTSTTIRSVPVRFDADSPQWRPVVPPPTTTRTTTTTSDPCADKFLCDNGTCIEQTLVCDGKDDCGNRLDEENCTHLGYEVRLSNKHQGRIEVKVLDKWGYVCDDNFTMQAANVLCRELGFKDGATELKPGSFYPPHAEMVTNGSAVFVMDDVQCTGNETLLKDCTFAGWGTHDCTADEVMGVICKETKLECPANYWLCESTEECVQVDFLCDNVIDCADASDEGNVCLEPLEIRLVDGPSEIEGRVEVKYRGMWGTICDDNIGVREARVICRQLGLNGTAQVRKGNYNAGKGQIWLEQILCGGDESTIEECTLSDWGAQNCNHNMDIGVRCGNPPPPEPQKLALMQKENDRHAKFDFVEKSRKSFPDTCGQLQVDPNKVKPTYGARVIDGGQTVYGHHPWQAALKAKKNNLVAHWCGAVLISSYHILTAAHCVYGYSNKWVVRLGDYHTEYMDAYELDVIVKETIVHEKFRRNGYHNNDIAILVVVFPIRFNQHVQPICLPHKYEEYKSGMECTISGWGAVSAGSSSISLELKAAKVPIIPPSVCSKTEVYGNNITEGMFCAGKLQGGIDTCDGDSGGPLVCLTDRGQTLFGIVSWGLRCGDVNKPGVYVKVAHYIDWIQEKLNYTLHTYGV